MFGLSDFRPHSKSGPFATQPLFDHEKSKLVRSGSKQISRAENWIFMLSLQLDCLSKIKCWHIWDELLPVVATRVFRVSIWAVRSGNRDCTRHHISLPLFLAARGTSTRRHRTTFLVWVLRNVWTSFADRRCSPLLPKQIFAFREILRTSHSAATWCGRSESEKIASHYEIIP